MRMNCTNKDCIDFHNISSALKHFETTSKTFKGATKYDEESLVAAAFQKQPTISSACGCTTVLQRGRRESHFQATKILKTFNG